MRIGLIAVGVLALVAVLSAQDELDLGVINRIKSEALARSQVMEHAFYLTDVHGPRLTGSPGFVAAAEWAEGRMRQIGLTDVHREALDWQRGWALERFSAELLTPQFAPLIGFPLPWSSSTKGEVRGAPMLAAFTEGLSERTLEAYISRYKGRLKGQIVLFSEARPLTPVTRAPMSRFTADELAELEQQDIPRTSQAPPSPSPSPSKPAPSFSELADRLVRFLNAEGVRLLIMQEFGDGGGAIEADRPLGSNWLRRRMHEPPPPMIVLGVEHYNRLARLAARGIGTEIAVSLTARFIDPATAFNLVADLPGADKAEELVIIGAHFDSWTGRPAQPTTRPASRSCSRPCAC